MIVGLGLSGTCLSQTLRKEYNKSVFVVDHDGGKKCSRIAIGTFNPVVFKTFTHTWKAPELIPFLKEFYGGMSKNLITDRPVYKSFKSEDQKRLWHEKSQEEPFAKFLFQEEVPLLEGVISPLGFGKVRHSGNLDMIQFLDDFRNILKKEGALLEERMNYAELEILEDEIRYKKVRARKVIFCEGHETLLNPWFSYLPFKETKGEVLIIRVEGWKPGGIVHNGINIVPMSDGLYWVGSTFDWDDKSLETTESARKKLIDQLAGTINVPYEIVEQKAGIRPTVKDRRPILGQHPREKLLHVFNGMGTRGVMLAPYFAKEMAEYLENGKVPEKEVDINRFNEQG